MVLLSSVRRIVIGSHGHAPGDGADAMMMLLAFA
jgi:hypothetical protein